MQETQNASAAGNVDIEELYQEFKALKNYLDSNKKARSQFESTPDKQTDEIQQPPIIMPVLLATPQTKKPYKSRNKTTTCKQQKQDFVTLQKQKSDKNSQHTKTHQELIDEYYKHYEYSIKKVLKYKEKNSKKKEKHKEQEQAKVDPDENKRQKEVSRRLEFEEKGSLNQENQKIVQNQQLQSSKTGSIHLLPVHQLLESTLNNCIQNFTAKTRQNLQVQESKLVKISQNLRKIKNFIPQKPKISHESVEMQDFNELQSQKDNQSVYSQTLQNRLQQI